MRAIDSQIITQASKAESDINTLLCSGSTALYRPWQFADARPVSLRLHTTFDEVSILWKVDAQFREGYDVSGENITIPTIMAKICGTHERLNEYKAFSADLVAADGCKIMVTDTLPLLAPPSPADLEPMATIKNTASVIAYCKKKIATSERFAFLRPALRRTMADKFDDLLGSNGLFHNESLANKVAMACSLLNMPSKLLQAAQSQDYPGPVPKLVVFCVGDAADTICDRALLAFLSLIGFDVLVFTPTGAASFEDSLGDFMQVHRLPKLRRGLLPLLWLDLNGPRSSTKEDSPPEARGIGYWLVGFCTFWFIIVLSTVYMWPSFTAASKHLVNIMLGP